MPACAARSSGHTSNFHEWTGENVMNRTLLALAAALVAICAPLAAPAAAQSMADDVRAINNGWAHITYEMNGSSHQTQALDNLDRQASQLVARYPGQADPLLWEGIVVSEEANRANIFHQLGLAYRARDLLARAYAINPKTANGGAAMSLGVLYYKVPGSPIGFGNKDRARQLLLQALALDPGGLDANYLGPIYIASQFW
jgi:tetratricopeptide (TPR) repeat protein